MAYPVVPTVPTGQITVQNQLKDQAGNLVTVPTTYVQLKAQAITANTPVDVYTPATGKKFRLLSYSFSSVGTNAAVKFEDGTGTEVLRTPTIPTGTSITSPPMGEGITSGAADTHLFLDATANATLSGYIGVCDI